MKIEVNLVNSFTVNGTGGNPAGVVLNADHLTTKQKLSIAKEVGYSETAFVSNDDKADFEVSFFTTTGEVDFCGHATLAAFYIMHLKGIITADSYIQSTKAGMLSVKVTPTGEILMEQQLPQKIASFAHAELSTVLGMNLSVLASTQLPIEVISTGLADVIIPIPHGHLDTIKPNDELISAFCRQHNVIGFHLFELEDSDSKLTASCRNFAPLFGISEESATGSASGALACYLTEHLALGTKFIFEQGRAMNCTSVINACTNTTDSKVTGVKVGGYASTIGTMEVVI